ncbi:MAG TPA: SMP-30/gluconolactonase/LRE family protein [Alphaproteobacteria bacterium]|jgi:sugar lactone lactonase YvrE|nr:SMP-30/gluconolactonase/LRE family protein [Alphaproteobacteria bacterium]
MVTDLGPVSTLTDNLAFPEDPRWHKGHLYFADMLDRRVARIDHDGLVTTLATFEDSPSGIGFLPGGDMLVVSMYHEHLIRVDAQGNKSLYADLGTAAGAGVNDMVVDREGRAYIVQFGGDHYNPTAAPLIVVQPDGSVGTDGEPLMVGNGIRITDDGKTLVVAESAGKQISLFDIGTGGKLSNRRIVPLPEGHFPDGICLDAQGGIWVAALWNGLIRITHTGELTHRIKQEGDRSAYACMYGGSDHDTLYICSSGPYDNEKARITRAGRIETIVTGFTGAGLD